MQPDDRVLVAYVPKSTDFQKIQNEHWYRIPVRHAPKGIHAEWIAFYFGRNFGKRKYAIHYYARNKGHELTTRAALLPDEPNHPRANDMYFAIQLSDLIELAEPIISLKWRRILFIHTTGDRFQDAAEINDLLIEGDGYVDRKFTVLRERGEVPYLVSAET